MNTSQLYLRQSINFILKSSLLCSLASIIFLSETVGQRTLNPGQSFRDCSDCPQMIVIPSGKFLMGSPENEPSRDALEGPQREVTLKRFAVAKFDITRGEWESFVTATKRPVSGGCAWSGVSGSAKPWELNPDASWQHLGFSQDGHHPVVCLSWQDVQDYLEWLSKKAGTAYRLLTEAEWEYASRAGSATAFPWGDTASHAFANYGADSGYVGIAVGADKWVATSPVASFRANAFGLFDMNGNVMTYLQDYFSDNYSHAPSDGSAYSIDTVIVITTDLKWMNGTRSSEYRMVRGGNYGDPPRMLRSAFRNWTPGPGATLQTYRSAALGLRVARSL